MMEEKSSSLSPTLRNCYWIQSLLKSSILISTVNTLTRSTPTRVQSVRA
jgi:hypothetical protein